MRATAINVLGENRHQRRIRRDRPREHADQQQQRACRWELRHVLKASTQLNHQLAARAAGPGSRGKCIRATAMITATNENALSAKHTASLTTARSSPASAGPTTRAALTINEFSAIALGKSARSSTR